MHVQIVEAAPAPMQYAAEQVITVRYKNYRGEIAVRKIVPVKMWFGKTEYHPHEQWIMTVWDCEKAAYRDYALQDILEFIK
jgi:hypothetical protein